MMRRRLIVSAVLLVTVAGPVVFARHDIPQAKARRVTQNQMELGLHGTGAGIETSPAYTRSLAAMILAFETDLFGRAEATVRAKMDMMMEAARARDGLRLPTLHFPETIWICGGCIPLSGLDWAELNAEFYIEPNQFLGADPTEAVSRAFLDWRVLTVEWLDDPTVLTDRGAHLSAKAGLRSQETSARRATSDESAIRDAFFALMLGLRCAEERWVPPEWDMVSPTDFTAYLGLRPNLRITMTGETFLLAEIDTSQGLVVFHTGGKRGVYKIEVGALLSQLNDTHQEPDVVDRSADPIRIRAPRGRTLK